MNRLTEAHRPSDSWAVAAFVVSEPGYEGNPNVLFIPLSLGNAYVNRYEWRHDIADFERGLEWFEWVAGNHCLSDGGG
jgi:hypothetical protein